MQSKIILLGIVVIGLASVWWYYPALQDMRAANHREAKCRTLWEKVSAKERGSIALTDAEFVQANCSK